MDELDQIMAEANAELEAEQAQSASTADFLSGLGSKALQGATFGFGDEASAYLNSGIDKARAGVMGLFSDDVMPPKSYDQYLSENRRNMRMAGEASPVIATGLEVAGSIASPNPLGKLKGANLAGKVGYGMLGGATNAGLYAFGSGEGGATERLVNALDDTAYGAGIGGALPVVGKVASFVGDKVKKAGISDQLRALGLTKADLKKSAKNVAGQNVLEPEDTNLLKSFRALKNRGEFDLRGGSLDAGKLSAKFGGKEIPERAEMLDDVIALADRRTGKKQFVPIAPQMTNSYGFIEGTKTLNRATGEDKLAKKQISQALSDLRKNTPGKLKDLQDQKQFYQTKEYETVPKASQRTLDKSIARDFKNQIEKVVDSLADKGRIGYKHKGSVQKLNKEMGEYITMNKIMKEKASTSALDSSFQDAILNSLRTTGGSGSAMTALAVTGLANPALAPIIYMIMQNPRMRYLGGQGLEGLGELTMKGGSKLKDSQGASLVRILEALKQGE